MKKLLKVLNALVKFSASKALHGLRTLGCRRGKTNNNALNVSSPGARRPRGAPRPSPASRAAGRVPGLRNARRGSKPGSSFRRVWRGGPTPFWTFAGKRALVKGPGGQGGAAAISGLVVAQAGSDRLTSA